VYSKTQGNPVVNNKNNISFIIANPTRLPPGGISDYMAKIFPEKLNIKYKYLQSRGRASSFTEIHSLLKVSRRSFTTNQHELAPKPKLDPYYITGFNTKP
jgi:hypothetical protein